MDKVITLPSSSEIMERLTGVSDDSLTQKLASIIAQKGGEEKVAEGVALMFTLAIYDASEGYPPILAALLYRYVPQFIDALVDDQEVAEKAKQIIAEAIG